MRLENLAAWMVGASERPRFPPFGGEFHCASPSLMKALTTAVQTYMFTRAKRWWHAVRYRVLNTWFRADHLTRSLCWIASFHLVFWLLISSNRGIVRFIIWNIYFSTSRPFALFFSQVCSIAIASHLVDTLGFRASFLCLMLHDISDFETTSHLSPTVCFLWVLRCAYSSSTFTEIQTAAFHVWGYCSAS